MLPSFLARPAPVAAGSSASSLDALLAAALTDAVRTTEDQFGEFAVTWPSRTSGGVWNTLPGGTPVT
jgi:hypothetical protein